MYDELLDDTNFMSGDGDSTDDHEKPEEDEEQDDAGHEEEGDEELKFDTDER